MTASMLHRAIPFRLTSAQHSHRHGVKLNSIALSGRHGSLQGATSGPFSRLRDLFFSSDTSSKDNAAPQTPALAPAMPRDYLLPLWAERFTRQIPALPNGSHALQHLLSSFEDVKAKAAEGCAGHAAVVEPYLHLALIDVISQGWQQRMEELQALQSRLEAKDTEQHQQAADQVLEARLALCGCRYLRIAAVNALAKQVHYLLDHEGHHPSLNLSGLPPPHTIGLNFGQLLQQGLGLDLQNPAIKTLSEEEVQDLQCLSWDAYHEKATDPSLCGEWAYGFWCGQATFVPAAYGKFSTAQLSGLLTPDVVLASLENGVWGRALVAAAIEVGLVLDSWVQQPLHVMAGAGSVGSASAWLFLESQFGLQGNLQKMRQLALSVAAAAVTVLQQHQQQQ